MEIKNGLRKNITNFFGALGYLSCSIQWLWAVVVNFSLLEILVEFLKSNAGEQTIQTTNLNDYSSLSSDSNIIFMVFAAMITLFMIIFTLYVIIKIPSAIVKTSKKIVQETAESAAPVVLKIQHQKDTKKAHKKLTFRLILIIKTALIIVPVVLAFISQFAQKQMFDYSFSIYIGLWLALFSAIFFAFQYCLAKFMSVDKKDI